MPALPSPGKVVMHTINYIAGGRTSINRIFTSYTGGGNNLADLTTLQTAILAAWQNRLKRDISSDWSIDHIVSTDLQTSTSPQSTTTSAVAGTDASQSLPAGTATLVSAAIPRRYRGGHPRLYLPYPGFDQISTPRAWKASFVSQVNGDMALVMSDINALVNVSYAGTKLVNVSYYSGFHNVTLPSGRQVSRPLVRGTPLVDVISGYTADTRPAFQSRRMGKDLD